MIVGIPMILTNGSHKTWIDKTDETTGKTVVFSDPRTISPPMLSIIKQGRTREREQVKFYPPFCPQLNLHASSVTGSFHIFPGPFQSHVAV
jgi:hypothetical protein